MKLKVPKIPLIYRYIIKEYLLLTLFFVSIVIFIIVLLDVVEFLRKDIIKNNINISQILLLTVFDILPIFQTVLPFFAFFSSLIFFRRLQNNKELIIFQSVGLSIWKILAPIIVINIIVGVFNAFVLSYFVPISEAKKQAIYDYKYNFKNVKRKILLAQDRHTQKIIIIEPDEADITDNSPVKNIIEMNLNKDYSLTNLYFAKRGSIFNKNIFLKDVYKVHNQTLLPVKDRIIQLPYEAKRGNISKKADKLSLIQNMYIIKLRKSLGISSDENKIQIIKLLFEILLFPAMAVIAASLNLEHKRRNNVIISTVQGIIICIIIYALSNFVLFLASNGYNPWLGLASHTLFIWLVSIFLILKKERV